MCKFKDGTRAATAASQANAELDEKVQVSGRVWFFSSANE